MSGGRALSSLYLIRELAPRRKRERELPRIIAGGGDDGIDHREREPYNTHLICITRGQDFRLATAANLAQNFSRRHFFHLAEFNSSGNIVCRRYPGVSCSVTFAAVCRASFLVWQTPNVPKLRRLLLNLSEDSEAVTNMRKHFVEVYRALALFTMAAMFFLVMTVAGQQPASEKPRPLPKPPKGSRGFEQYAGRDASTRLIGMGATRDVTTPRKPFAPLLGLAYNPRPFFAWGEAFGEKSYRFVLYEGDVFAKPDARVVFETDVSGTEFIYPSDKPALTPGMLYSWRVFTTSDKNRDAGLPVTFFVLAESDAAEVSAALAKSGLLTPKNEADRLRQLDVLKTFGIWYDALHIVSEVAEQNPDDLKAQQHYEDLLAALEGK